MFDPQLVLQESNTHLLLHSCTPWYSFCCFLSLSISHYFYSWENWYPEVTTDLSRILFHLRTNIFIFPFDFHFQAVASFFKRLSLTLSADIGFPWQNQWRIKTNYFFPENVAGHKSFVCHIPSKSNSSLYIVFQRNQTFSVVFLVFISLLSCIVFGMPIRSCETKKIIR